MGSYDGLWQALVNQREDITMEEFNGLYEDLYLLSHPDAQVRINLSMVFCTSCGEDKMHHRVKATELFTAPERKSWAIDEWSCSDGTVIDDEIFSSMPRLQAEMINRIWKLENAKED